MLKALAKRCGVLLCAGLLTACDDGTGPDRLTAEDVAGIYQVCALAFDPAGDLLPVVDIRSAAFELSRPNALPELNLDPTRTLELEFVPKGQFSDRELRGTFDVGRETVILRFNRDGVLPATLLVPENDPIEFLFQRSPQVLTLESSREFTVPRAEFARLAGTSEANLPERISGQLSARFAAPTCG